MALTQLTYALTTVDRVNAQLGFTTSDNATRDQIIADIIASVTDFIQGYCGGRMFKATDYTEVCDIKRTNYLFLKHRPVNSITSVKYRTGQPSTPTWVDYYTDGYLKYLGSGMIRFFSQFVPFPQAFQVAYNAGYTIDFTNFNDPTKHTLPRDLTQVANELTVKEYNMMNTQGIFRETTEGQQIEYETSTSYELSTNHKAVLNKYKITRVATAV